MRFYKTRHASIGCDRCPCAPCAHTAAPKVQVAVGAISTWRSNRHLQCFLSLKVFGSLFLLNFIDFLRQVSQDCWSQQNETWNNTSRRDGVALSCPAVTFLFRADLPTPRAVASSRLADKKGMFLGSMDEWGCRIAAKPVQEPRYMTVLRYWKNQFESVFFLTW